MFSKKIESVAEILPYYDHYIIDLWGVVHDGTELYPSAINALKTIKGAGKKIIFLSNAPRRKHKVGERIDSFGIERSLYDDIVSSGEILFNTIDQYISREQKNYFYIGYEKDMDILEDTNFIQTNDIEKADFILCADLEDGLTDRMSEGLKENLKIASEKGLIFLCANPDIYIVKQSGGTQYCAGYIGDYYEKMSGKVIYFGKPYGDGYKDCLKAFSTDDLSRVVAIGDSFHTDIKGASNFGIDSLLVKCGIHRDSLKEDLGLEKLVQEYKICPTFNIESFK